MLAITEALHILHGSKFSLPFFENFHGLKLEQDILSNEEIAYLLKNMKEGEKIGNII